MKNLVSPILSTLVILLFACGGDKFPLPEQSDVPDGTSAIDDTVYIQLNPVWGPETDATNYNFNQPKDILLGREPFIYIADSGNDRIVMLDLAGNVVGTSQPVENPIGLTQDSKLRLHIVTDSNKIFRIDLVAVQHDITTAPVELMFEEVDNPDRRYTGIAAFVRTNVLGEIVFGYYVSATGNDTRDNQILIFPEDFVVPRTPNAINLEPNGLGILSASEPSGVTTLRDFTIDLIFCMVGQNSFKVQWLTGGEFGFTTRISPADGSFDIFEPGKFFMPEDVTVDPEGNIYVVDAQRDFMFKFSSQGDEQQSFGDASPGPGGQLNQPHGVGFFDKTLYIADTGNNRILRFRLSTDVGD